MTAGWKTRTVTTLLLAAMLLVQPVAAVSACGCAAGISPASAADRIVGSRDGRTTTLGSRDGRTTTLGSRDGRGTTAGKARRSCCSSARSCCRGKVCSCAERAADDSRRPHAAGGGCHCHSGQNGQPFAPEQRTERPASSLALFAFGVAADVGSAVIASARHRAIEATHAAPGASPAVQILYCVWQT